MGKVRVKSFNKAKAAASSSRNVAVPMEMSAGKGQMTTTTPSPLKSSVSSGRITKSPKKSVSFRSNLTDVMSDALKAGSDQMDLEDVLSSNNLKKTKDKKGSKFSVGKIMKKEFKDKKSRLRMKKKEFMKKIELIKNKAREEKDAAKRKETPIVGDTKALLDALIEATPESKSPEVADMAARPSKKRFNMKKRQKEIADGLDYFAAALHLPAARI